MSPRRADTGGRVDRQRTIRFTFDGIAYTGHAGDTLASALLANGVTLFGRSFKYHRPRGVLSAGVEEPNALVTVLKGEFREPNLPATMVEIHDGLIAVSQNRTPTLAWDIGALNQLGGKVLAAGFYYKTFMGPVFGPLKGTRFWMFCEHFIRRAAGLGRAGSTPDKARYERMNAFCDVLVVGSGPAGLMAATAAAEQGANVILAELDPQFGGSANWSGETIDGMPAASWARRVAGQLERHDNVRLLPRTTVWGHYDGNVMAAIERVSDFKERSAKGEPRHRHWTIRAKSVVLATGSLERPLVFPGNDRPGVMLAHAAQRYANEFGVLPGSKIALFTNNDSAYGAAVALKKAGAAIVAIVDVRSELSAETRSLASAAEAELLNGHAVVATEGGKGLSGIKVQRFDAVSGALTGDSRSIHADCLLMSGGWSPTIHLASQAGARAQWSPARQAFLPPKPGGRWIGAGAFTGSFSTDRRGPRGRALRGRRTCRARRAAHSRGDALRSRSSAGLRDQGQGQELRRLPARRDVGGRAPCPSRRLHLGRASEALHHARHGHGPGQELQRAGPGHYGPGARQAYPRGRHDPLPSALRGRVAGLPRGRTLRRPQARAADADA